MDQKIFRRATYAIFLCGSYPMLVVGCYFGHIPWNMKRLSMDESDLGLAILVFGIFPAKLFYICNSIININQNIQES